MKNLICLINSYLAFFIFHLFFLHFSMTTLLQLGVHTSILLLYCFFIFLLFLGIEDSVLILDGSIVILL